MKPNVEYTAHFVNDPRELLRQHPPELAEIGKIHAHHATIDHLPHDGTRRILIGRTRILHAIGYVVTEDVHALVVNDPSGEPFSYRPYPHITIATAPGIGPAVSNGALEAAYRDGTVLPIEPPLEIPTTEGYYNGRYVVTKPRRHVNHDRS